MKNFFCLFSKDLLPLLGGIEFPFNHGREGFFAVCSRPFLRWRDPAVIFFFSMIEGLPPTRPHLLLPPQPPFPIPVRLSQDGDCRQRCRSFRGSRGLSRFFLYIVKGPFLFFRVVTAATPSPLADRAIYPPLSSCLLPRFFIPPDNKPSVLPPLNTVGTPVPATSPDVFFLIVKASERQNVPCPSYATALVLPALSLFFLKQLCLSV